MGVDNKLVEKSGAWYSCMGERIGQGKENARQYLKDNPKMASSSRPSCRESWRQDRASRRRPHRRVEA
jgi:recombination protein RecA